EAGRAQPALLVRDQRKADDGSLERIDEELPLAGHRNLVTPASARHRSRSALWSLARSEASGQTRRAARKRASAEWNASGASIVDMWPAPSRTRLRAPGISRARRSAMVRKSGR